MRNYAGALILAPQEPNALICIHMRWGVKDELTIPMMEYSFKEQWRTGGQDMVCALNKYHTGWADHITSCSLNT